MFLNNVRKKMAISSIIFSIIILMNPIKVFAETQQYTVDEVIINENYISKEEFLLLCQCVWTEDRGGTYEGQRAVAQVVLNRVDSDLFPDTISEVILQPNQFDYSDCYSQKYFSFELISAVTDTIYEYYNGEKLYPENMLFFNSIDFFKDAKYGQYIDYQNIDGNYFSLYLSQLEVF
jgi:hypothetical protein